MDADQLLQALGVSLGLPTLRFDANGCARLAVDRAPALNFERDHAGGIHVYSVIGAVPPEGREALYARLLRANLFGEGTGGSMLAVDDQLGEVVLCCNVKVETTSVSDFGAAMEAFVATAEQWQNRMDAPALEAAPAGPSFAPAHAMESYVRG